MECIVCSEEVSDSENEGDEDNPLCEGCADQFGSMNGDLDDDND